MVVARTVFCMSLALASFAPAQSDLKKTVRELRAAMLRNPEGATPAQLDALEDFGIDFGNLGDGDRRSMGIVLEHAAKSSGEELDDLIAYALSDRGHDLRWAFVMVAIHRRKYDDAANLAITACLPVAEGQRAYRVWKWWQHVMFARADYGEATREFSLALLQRSQQGGDKVKRAVQDIIGKGEITAKTLPKLRQQAIDGVKSGNARFQAQWQSDSVGKPKTMWIEDRLGLRKIERKSFWRRARASWRRDVRLGTTGSLVMPIQLRQDADRWMANLESAIKLAGSAVAKELSSRSVVWVADRCTGSTEHFEVGDIGENVNKMLVGFVRAGREQGVSEQHRRLVFRTLRMAATESRRLLAGAVTFEDSLTEYPASAVARGAAVFVNGGYKGPEAEGDACAIEAGKDLTLLNYLFGGLTVVQFDRVGVVTSIRMEDETLALATVSTPTTASGAPLVRVAWQKEHVSWQANVAPESKDGRLVRQPIKMFEVRSSSSEQQAAVAAKLRSFIGR